MLSYLKPQAIVKMHLAHPEKSMSFDRCSREDVDNRFGLTSQSSADRYREFDHVKAGDLLVGDFFPLPQIFV